MRVVLDANVFVSAVLGIPAKILTAWHAERFHLVISPAILEEIDLGQTSIQTVPAPTSQSGTGS